MIKNKIWTNGPKFETDSRGIKRSIFARVFGSLHHLQMRLQPDKNQKNRRQKNSVFTAGSKFRSISRVMGVINEFGLR